ncbi:MAG: histidine--tRNA ligase [Bacteroidales bacterium]|nr:histidine--tRNA ligase [Bacteroidales bacterium]
MQKPSIPKGTRDFTPAEMLRREYIFNTIRGVFKKYGYSPIETPAMENLSTLLDKYGEEGDKLLFKILNSGDFLSKTSLPSENPGDSNKFSLEISEKGLRYDLTVPFARFVVQNRNSINFPFKRYQIQPVWRADRPQKGRYREFYQCDADVIGSNSLLNEVELLQIIEEVFEALRVNITVKLNNRKILAGISEVIGEPEKLTDITVAIDKIEKIGPEKVIGELKERGLSDPAISALEPFLCMKEQNLELISRLKTLLGDSETGMKGIEEIENLFRLLTKIDSALNIEFDLTLARGLNYYTGAIIEVKANDAEIGSICGGGRYDNLTGIFGLPDVSGVGISFGADRIYDVLNQLELYPEGIVTATQILILNFGEKEQEYALSLAQQLRRAGIRTEIFPDSVKIKKQMNYANNQNIPFVLMVGEQEIINNSFTLKDMASGEQASLNPGEIISRLAEYQTD